MALRWIDLHLRRSLALAAVILGVTGSILFARPDRALGTPRELDRATDDRPREGGRTAAAFEGPSAHGRIAVSHGRLLANGARRMFVELRIGADERGETARAPLALVLTIDTSGSMAGQKIVEARRAARALLAEMRDDDAIAVVRFASDAELVVPLAPVREARARAERAIDALSASGDTNIARAVRIATDELSSRGEQRVKRVALVTDGRDTSGSPRRTAADVARRESGHGVTISTLGIGLDYDDAYLSELAAAGHGNYEFLRDGTSLARFLSRELEETAKTTVERATVDLALPPETAIRGVSGATWERTTGGARLTLGSLFAGDERRVLVTLEVPVGDVGTSLEIGGVAAWSPLGRARTDVTLPSLRVEAASSMTEVEAARDRTVLATATSVTASEREKEAAAAYQRGDRARAIELNRQSIGELAEAAAAAPAMDAQRLRAQSTAYADDARAFASPPSAASGAARPIVARESKNLLRELAY